MSLTIFKGKNSFLSNFTLCELRYKDIDFISIEQAYQWGKAENLKDKEAILKCKSSKESKKIGHSIKCDIKKWDLNKEKVMYELLKIKFANDNLKRMLIETGDLELIETNYWHDLYWSNCMCYKCKEIPSKNIHGKLLMKIRDELI